MVKSVLGVNHQGLTEWVIQRVTAIIMAVYFIVLMGYILLNPGLSFAEWHSHFSNMLVKVATMLFILSVLYHAWIGMWTVFTDYIKCSVLRAIIDFFVLLMLFGCFFWGLFIIWGV